jgi:hypothetical protein
MSFGTRQERTDPTWAEFVSLISNDRTDSLFDRYGVGAKFGLTATTDI